MANPINYTCEVLHLATDAIWAFDHEVEIGSPEWHEFQYEPETTSAIFVRYYNPSQDEQE
jgi:hypothetical protein